MKKLTTTPLSPDPADRRKVLRTRNGHALDLIETPISIFWTYDDHGENDPDLVIWYMYETGGTGTYQHPIAFWGTQCLNLPGLSYPLYTEVVLARTLSRRGAANSPIRLWAMLSDATRSRGMTFWLFGKKIHVTAGSSDLYEDLDTFIGKIEISEDRRFTVNGEYRGIWPYPS